MTGRQGRRSVIKVICAIALAVMIGGASESAHVAAAASPWVALGAQPGWAVGTAGIPISPDTPVDISVLLRLRNEAGLERLAQGVSTPGNAAYRHYIKPSAFHDMYSPTQASVDAVTAYLTANGLHIVEIPDNRLYVRASGAAANVGRAFNTQLAGYVVRGVSLHGPMSAPALPATIAQEVAAVDGLSNSAGRAAPANSVSNPASRRGSAPTNSPANTLPGPPPAFVEARPCSSYWGQTAARDVPPAYGIPLSWAPCGYTGSQFRGAYGVGALAQHGVDGRGVTVAIVDAYPAITISADAAQYNRNRGEPQFKPGQLRQMNASRFVNPEPPSAANPNGCDAQRWYLEGTLDVEAIHAVAPGADVLYLGARSCLDMDLLSRENLVIDHELAQVISNSWSDFGDIDQLPAEVQKAYGHTFQQAVVEGIGLQFSTGDAGDEVADLGYRTVNFPASDPWVTAVGGTTLAIGATNNYLFETGWGTSGATVANGAWSPAPPGAYFNGTGGGTSQVFAQPFYQKNVVPAAISRYFGGNGRATPDISMEADPNTGLLIGESMFFPADPNDANNPNGTVKYGEFKIGGTSLSCPLFAAMIALADQGQEPPVGFANPALYRMSGTSAIRDVVDPPKTVATVANAYNNNVDATGGVTTVMLTMNTTGTLFTRPGYDDVTGVGTPRGTDFMYALADQQSG